MTSDQQTTPHRRRKFRYSLRTLLVAVTLVAVFVGYHVNWIRQRHAILAGDGRPKFTVTSVHVDGSGPVTAPGLLRLFGEQGHRAFAIDFLGPREHSPNKGLYFLNSSSSDLKPDQKAEIERIQHLFPESRVLVVAP